MSAIPSVSSSCARALRGHVAWHAVNGGFGDWPGLAPAKLYEGSDLRPTTDLRSVFKGVLRDHLGVPATLLNASIFPDSKDAAPALGGLVAHSAKAGAIASGVLAPLLRDEPAIARYRGGQRVSKARFAAIAPG
jgi:hypothetical protein